MFYTETGSVDPYFNLAFEEYVLKEKKSGDWLILWQNKNAVIVGLNQNPLEEIDPDFVKARQIAVVRRITGGGAVYHDLGNLNYSFITDIGSAEHLTITRFSKPVCRALESMGVQAEVSGRNDITVQGRKISGVAQRIEGSRILHHGTLLFDSDPNMVAGALRADPAKFQSKSSKSVRSRIGNIRDFLPVDMDLAIFWQRLLTQLTADEVHHVTLSAEDREKIHQLAEQKYRSWDWTWGRSPSYQVKNRKRWPGGTLEVRLEIQDGTIRDILFYGDFMAAMECTAAMDALRGVWYRKEAVRGVLDRLDLRPMFGGLTAEHILHTIF